MVGSLPGVRSATAVSSLPLQDPTEAQRSHFVVENKPEPDEGDPAWDALLVVPTPGYFETLRIPLSRGRTFNESDQLGSPLVAIVNETFANLFWPGEDPIGKRITRPLEGTPWLTIVGIVGDVKRAGLDITAAPIYYIPHAQTRASVPWLTRRMALLVEAAGDPRALVPSLQASVWQLDGDLPLSGIETLDEIVSNSVGERRFFLVLLGLFAWVALAIGTIGIYGLLSYTVAQRTREIGIRKALGARAPHLVTNVIREGMILTLVGIAIGIAAAVAVTRVLSGMLYGVSPTDATTFIALSTAFAAVALAACWIPAWRASQVSPMNSLRAE